MNDDKYMKKLNSLNNIIISSKHIKADKVDAIVAVYTTLCLLNNYWG